MEMTTVGKTVGQCLAEIYTAKKKRHGKNYYFVLAREQAYLMSGFLARGEQKHDKKNQY